MIAVLDSDSKGIYDGFSLFYCLGRPCRRQSHAIGNTYEDCVVIPGIVLLRHIEKRSAFRGETIGGAAWDAKLPATKAATDTATRMI
jgi:hypothetical protein